MHVILLQHTPEPEKLVAAAAKLCYSASGADELMGNLDDGEIVKFLGILSNLGHESPMEHMSFTFAVDGISRVLTHQLVRHRMASYSQQSQRYVKLEQFEYIVPPAIRKDPRALALFTDAMEQDQRAYDELTDLLYEAALRENLEKGMAEKKAAAAAEKTAIEDARYVFPNACETKIVITMNARSLLNFFSHRCCERAQWEIREMADLMLMAVKRVAPTIFKNSGPNCVNGPCPEGAMTCGHSVKVRDKYNKL